MTRAFPERWIVNPPARSLLESEESSQMCDYASIFGLLTDMRVVPFSWRAVLGLAVLLALPALPVVMTELPLTKLLPKLVRLVGGAPV